MTQSLDVGYLVVFVQDVRSLNSLRVCVPSIESEVFESSCSWCKVYERFVLSLKYFRFFIQCAKSLNSLRVFVLKNECDLGSEFRVCGS